MHSFKTIFQKDTRVIEKKIDKTMHMETIISTIVIVACIYFFSRRKLQNKRQTAVRNLRIPQTCSKKKSRKNLHTPGICA